MEKNVKIGFYTSGSRLIVSVLDGKKFSSARRKVFNQETYLFPLLSKILPAKKTIADIAEVCAIKGPGRFTGIRIGLTAAGSMQALSGVQVFTATVFEVMACQAAESNIFRRKFPKGALVAIILHAFREEYFCAVYKVVSGKVPKLEKEPVWLQRAEMQKMLSGIKEKFFCIADIEEKKDIYALIPKNAVSAPKNISKILPQYLIKAPELFGHTDLHPLYLKPAKFELDAIKKEASKKDKK